MKGGLVRELNKFFFFLPLKLLQHLPNSTRLMSSPHFNSVFTTCGLIILTEILTLLYLLPETLWSPFPAPIPQKSHIPPLSGTNLSLYVKLLLACFTVFAWKSNWSKKLDLLSEQISKFLYLLIYSFSFFRREYQLPPWSISAPVALCSLPCDNGCFLSYLFTKSRCQVESKLKSVLH